MTEFPSAIKARSNESPPVVSVQMPVFNGAKYLAESIESILNQTFSDFEFLVIDDGSTDDSLKILRKYAENDSRLRVFARENRGAVFTVNELLSYTRGEFVAHMDQDDISAQDRLELQVNFLKKNPKVVAVGGASQLIDSAGRYLTTLTPPQTDMEIQQLMLSGHTAINHPAVMMRLAAVNQVGGYDIKYNLVEDLELFLRLGEIGELANLTEAVVKYRLHDKSASEKAGQKQIEAARRACENVWSRRKIAAGVFATQTWRPGTDGASRHKFMLQYGWWAWNSRQRKTAAYYGWQAIKTKPFSITGWKLLLVSLIKPLVSTQ